MLFERTISTQLRSVSQSVHYLPVLGGLGQLVESEDVGLQRLLFFGQIALGGHAAISHEIGYRPIVRGCGKMTE